MSKTGRQRRRGDRQPHWEPNPLYWVVAFMCLLITLLAILALLK